MGSRYLVDLADVLRAAGLAVVEQDGWESRARGSGGYDGDRPWCFMWHHTASQASPESDASYMSHGSENAPIANLLVTRDGTVWVLAAGATNTNGSGNSLKFSSGTVPMDSMNTHAIGCEIANSGVGEEYPAVQIDAAFTASLACCAAYGLAPADVAEHWQYAPSRKIDPATASAVGGSWAPRSATSSGTWEPTDLRAELERRWSGTTPPEPEPIPEPSPEPRDEYAVAFIIQNTNTGEIALVYGDRQVVGLAGEDVGSYEAHFGAMIPTNPVVWQGFLDKSH